MLSVLQSEFRTTGDQRRQILGRVFAPLTGVHTRTQQNRGVIEHRPVTFLCRFEEGQQSTEAFEMEPINRGELFQHALIATVMRQLVVIFAAATDPKARANPELTRMVSEKTKAAIAMPPAR